MKHLYHISRNFVEFGAFTANEVAGFRQRGILADHDYVRADNASHWTPLAYWINETTPTTSEVKTPAKSKSPASRKRAAPSAKKSKNAA